MNSFVATFLGPLPYFRLGLKHVAKLCSGFSKEIAMDRAMDYVSSSGIVGDYLEFGVWRGRAFAAACYLSRQRKLSMKFYAFDSFNGLPENKEVDATGHQMFRGGNYRCSEQEFLKNVRHTGADMSHVITVPGWFRESLRPDNPRISALQKAAVVWVDCDLYSFALSAVTYSMEHSFVLMIGLTTGLIQTPANSGHFVNGLNLILIYLQLN